MLAELFYISVYEIGPVHEARPRTTLNSLRGCLTPDQWNLYSPLWAVMRRMSSFSIERLCELIARIISQYRPTANTLYLFQWYGDTDDHTVHLVSFCSTILDIAQRHGYKIFDLEKRTLLWLQTWWNTGGGTLLFSNANVVKYHWMYCKRWYA